MVGVMSEVQKNAGHCRESGEGEGMSGWKESEVGEIPEQWNCLYIGNFADVTKLAGYEYTKHITYVDDGEIIALRALNVREGKLDLTDVDTRVRPTHQPDRSRSWQGQGVPGGPSRSMV